MANPTLHPLHEGRRRDTAKVGKYRWRSGWTVQPLDIWARREKRRRIRAFTLLGLSLLFAAVLVYCLLFLETRTPLVAIGATSYEWPLPPNAWTREDVESLESLDKETLTVFNLSNDWESKHSGLTHLKQTFADIGKLRTRTRTVVIYISMPGAVNGDGEPCLLPPGVSPLDSNTWLPLQELLAEIKRVKQSLPEHFEHLLLVLDCNRMLVNWNMGLLYNSFADGLADLVRQANVPGLVVLNSTSPEQIGWASPDLQASVFGHYFHLGLAGEADAPESGGNADRQVSLQELHRYLRDQVDRWARHNRADHQQPLLIPEGATDFTIAWSVNRAALRSLKQQAASIQRSESEIPESAIYDLWNKHDALKKARPWRFAPLLWRDFEHKLLWLEQLADGGKAYAGDARRVRQELENLHATISALPTPVPEDWVAGRLHTLPLARFMGRVNVDTAARIDSTLTRLRIAPGLDGLDEALATLEQEEFAAPLVETHFLRVLRRYQRPAWWLSSSHVADAIDLLQKAEQATVPMAVDSLPGDERSQYWVRPLAEEADKLRRRAVDRLLIGTKEALTAAQEYKYSTNASQQYDEARTRALEISKKLQIRDEAWAEVPYLVQWLTGPGTGAAAPRLVDRDSQETSHDQPATLQDDRESEHILDLIVNMHELDRMVVDQQPFREIEAKADQVERQLASWRERFGKHLEQLRLMPTKTPHAMREIEAVLSVPLVPANKRFELRNAYAQPPDDTSQGEQAPSEETQSASYSEFLARWQEDFGEHPVVAILDRKPTSDGAGESADDKKENGSVKTGSFHSTLAAEGDSVRQHLQMVQDRIWQSDHENGESIDEQATAQGDGGTDWYETDPRQAARMVRAASTLSFRPPYPDPVKRLRRLDLHQLMLWHCQRSLDDFWGSAGSSENPFFETAARDYLEIARKLDPDSDDGRDSLLQQLEKRVLAARGGLITTARDVLLINDTDDVTATVMIQAASDDARSLPPGQAAIFVRDLSSQDNSDQMGRARVNGTTEVLDVPLGQTDDKMVERSLEFPASDLIGRGPLMRAVTSFRANEFTAPFLLRPLDGVVVDYQPFEYDWPKVTLRGEPPPTASVVFVLDCSDTMRQLVEVERPGGTRRVSRLEVAVNALNRLIDGLVEKGNARVGVRFYGHRVGWNIEQPQELLRQDAYERPIPANLLPSEDVELVLPLGRLDSIAAGQVTRLMQSLKPWGESPIYAAMIASIGDLISDDVEAERSVVVITDGINYQFNSPDPKTSEDVLTARGQYDVRMHIVGFAIPEEESAEAEREFNRLAEASYGSFVMATDAVELLESLEHLLGPSQYEILNRDAQPVLPPLDIGTTAVVPQTVGKRVPYDVGFQTLVEPIELQGGEALELVVSRDRLRIEAARYGDPIFAPLVTGPRRIATSYRVGVHRPIWQSDGQSVKFRVSFQHTQRRFTRRPEEVWIEIRPRVPGGQQEERVYTFYDVNYVPDTPVPVLEWIARDWPKEAVQAEVRVWCKPEKTAPTASVPLREVANRTPARGAGHRVEGLPGFSIQVRTAIDGHFRVGVVGRHQVDASRYPHLKVELEQHARRVKHTFDDQLHKTNGENRITTHTFFFDTQDAQSVLDSNVNITTRADLEANSWFVDIPILTPVVDSDLLELTPPLPPDVNVPE